MRLLLQTILLGSAAIAHPALPQSQDVLSSTVIESAQPKHRKLQGRFLHVTDIHPDPFYRTGSSADGVHPCHRGEGEAGFFGAEKTECDSPITLINATFDWIKHNLRDEIDFVVWTGDSARHDNDELYPRSNKQIEQLNEFLVDKFDEVFGKPDNRHDEDPTNDMVVPIIPTFGNNDVLPHNILLPGPNKWTRKYLKIWEKFIPQQQRHSFARGGWFYVEVIPNKLAVISLNTLYFFDSNGAVDGCDEKSEPGYEHFEWLRVQLAFLRERKMFAILSGHVPPARTETKQNWDETCYMKYILWLRQYRDVIVGSLYGHMNIDHIMLHDTEELNYKFKIPGISDDLRSADFDDDEELHGTAKADYLTDLRDRWAGLPEPPKGISYDKIDPEASRHRSKHAEKKLQKFLKQIGGRYGERFSLSMVAPSVVPNFFPTLRIIEYNISGLEHAHPSRTTATPSDYVDSEYVEEFEQETDVAGQWPLAQDYEPDKSLLHDLDGHLDTMKKKKKHKKKSKPNFRIPDPPSRSAVPGPAYSPQPLSLLSIKQYYANITKYNEAARRDLLKMAEKDSSPQSELVEEAIRKHFVYELEYDSKEDKVYHMSDLTMRSWLGLTQKIGRTVYDPQLISDEEDGAAEDADDIEDSQADDVPHSEGHKKHKKDKKRKGKTLKKNKLWHTFLRRAFVGAKTDAELEDEFG